GASVGFRFLSEICAMQERGDECLAGRKTTTLFHTSHPLQEAQGGRVQRGGGSDLMIDEPSPDQASRRAPCANAFLTSDCEIPNCLAIADGLTPALKAARTAFSLPLVNEPAPSSEASWRRCGFPSANGFSFAGLGDRDARPRC